MLSEDTILKVYNDTAGGGFQTQESILAGLRAVAEAAVKDAVGGEEKYHDPCPNCMKGSVCRTMYCGRLKLPLDHPVRAYDPSKRPQASAAIKPKEDGWFVDALRAVCEYAVKAERHRIYAALEADPGALWRDQGFQEWRAKKSQETNND
jgi:hypothetical protein